MWNWAPLLKMTTFSLIPPLVNTMTMKWYMHLVIILETISQGA